MVVKGSTSPSDKTTCSYPSYQPIRHFLGAGSRTVVRSHFVLDSEYLEYLKMGIFRIFVIFGIFWILGILEYLEYW